MWEFLLYILVVFILFFIFFHLSSPGPGARGVPKILVSVYQKFLTFRFTIWTDESVYSVAKDFILYRVRGYISRIFSSGLLIRHKELAYIDLIYHDGLNTYTVRSPKQRRPKPFATVKNQDGIDVTNEVNKFIGPSHNFHGIPTTPCMLGYSQLHFQNAQTDETRTFNLNDSIIF
jgi:hypothetical protein